MTKEEMKRLHHYNSYSDILLNMQEMGLLDYFLRLSLF